MFIPFAKNSEKPLEPQSFSSSSPLSAFLSVYHENERKSRNRRSPTKIPEKKDRAARSFFLRRKFHQKIPENLFSLRGENRLRVELNPFHVVFFVANAHYDAVLGFRGYEEFLRQSLAFKD